MFLVMTIILKVIGRPGGHQTFRREFGAAHSHTQPMVQLARRGSRRSSLAWLTGSLLPGGPPPAATTGPDPDDPDESCPVCLEPLAPGAAPTSKVYLTTCHHALHVHCWEAHKRSTPPDSPVCCPQCRHEIIVSTAPTVVAPTGEAVPLRPGRERADLAHAMRG